ncbi:MAG: trehalose utilization protein ThuA [Planctomycetota bacterium]
MADLRITVWNEGRHEQKDERVRRVYPEGIGGALASALSEVPAAVLRTARLDDPEQGLSEAALAETDVLVWWSHVAHAEVSDESARRVQNRVLDGMGLIVLHSACESKPFRALMGTTGRLKWRDAGEKEILWIVKPKHPIVQGLDGHFVIEREEMYGEYWDIPEPDELIFISSFAGGEVFRSGCCWTRGAGKIFYFRPGHESYPTYFHPQVRRVLCNAARWAAPVPGAAPAFGNRKAGWI